MATIAPRPVSAFRARALSRTWFAVPAGLAALVLLSLVLRTRELGIGFWIDEGLSVGIADRPLGDVPGGPAARRLAAALLHAAARLDAGRRQLGGGRALAVGRLCADRRSGRVVGSARAVRHARRVDGGRSHRHEHVLHPVRAGGADVRAGRAAGAGGLGDLRARVRVGRARLGDRLRGRARRDALHAQLGAVLRRRLRARVAVSAVSRPRSARAARDRRDRLRRRAGALPALAADRALPGRPYGGAVVRAADRRRAARHARPDARAVRADRAPARGRRRARGPAAARRAFAGRLAAGRRDPHRRAGVAVVPALAGVGEPLPRGRGGAAAAGPHGRPRERGPAGDRRA